MVNYLPSSATRTITVLTAEVETTLTITAPASVSQGDLFNIYGQITRNDTGAAIPNVSISVSYNGTPLGSKLTDMQGIYTLPASIPTAGTFTLRASFAGMTVPGLTLGASSASRRIGLAEPSMLSLLALAGLIAYAVMKK